MRAIQLAVIGTSAVALCAALAGAADPAGAEGKAAPAVAKAAIEARSGSKLSGTAIFTEKDGAVEVVVSVTGAPPGPHAVHVHEKGDCSAPDAASAGGHFNPDGSQHGGPAAEHHHAGDFGNMTVGEEGRGELTISTKRLSVVAGTNSVVGRAIIVHEKADDLQTQPTGAAGGRIGCGVIQTAQ
jgi:Cu-Zn family superoxide dismutase